LPATLLDAGLIADLDEALTTCGLMRWSAAQRAHSLFRRDAGKLADWANAQDSGKTTLALP